MSRPLTGSVGSRRSFKSQEADWNYPVSASRASTQPSDVTTSGFGTRIVYQPRLARVWSCSQQGFLAGTPGSTVRMSSTEHIVIRQLAQGLTSNVQTS